MQTEVIIVDYGLGNLKSVSRAIQYCGGIPKISSDPNEIRSAQKIILPGVGAFGEGMKRLSEAGLDEAIKSGVKDGANLLGICLGMQMLMDTSEEFGDEFGLGLIKGPVRKINAIGDSGEFHRKVPHIGWSPLQYGPNTSSWTGSPLEAIALGSPVYFVHSFMACPTSETEIIASCNYGGLQISAVINHNKVWGMQFHPEKSGRAGLEMMNKFISMI
ncbi:imidazole glycerol phosphate synthase subunit HisH [Polynucleobacter sp. AP-Kaivos-20-H2]|uniref:imidazole glycerol phosphate synthase subunit HisH n=1 Tax=Polynucleobacter sp. AP-Kaivos-20-H2 TaxID=2689104 RepID=UPI001C0CC185|nr:imidazole glycerol phosphate synthase subunit HisH [Polynucleobacter sp. AP-Kaivos-20-H2]